jgi:succinate dehydrogenase / fumarate reductase cytochrome b subunit
MAITGIILVLYLIGHTLGNMQIYLGKDVLNAYAHFLQSTGELLWVIRIVLFLCVVLHIITSVYLKFYNLGAKPNKYQVKGYVKARLSSRTMIWTGIMIFAFVLYHLLHFTVGVTDPENYAKKHLEYYDSKASVFEMNEMSALSQSNVSNLQNKEVASEGKNSEASKTIYKSKDGKLYSLEGDEKVLFARPDVYYMVVKGFQNIPVSIFYIIAVVLLGFHLNHAIQSAFQTLGWNHPKYFKKVVAGSTILSIFIVACLISIPITILAGLVGRCI